MNSTMTSWIVLSVAVALTIGSGWWQGRQTNRWGTPLSTKAAAAKLEQIPAEFGDWIAESSLDLDPEVGAILQCSGYMNRRFVNQRTGQTVQIFIVLGPPGPISVHTPEVCYSGAGFTPSNATKSVAIRGEDGTLDEFNQVTLAREDGRANRLVVGYGWTTGRRFAVPQVPRWTFRNAPYLYKVQLAAQIGPSIDKSTSQAAPPDGSVVLEEFLRDFLPVLRPYLVPPST